jgi:hypothetical protein
MFDSHHPLIFIASVLPGFFFILSHFKHVVLYYTITIFMLRGTLFWGKCATNVPRKLFKKSRAATPFRYATPSKTGKPFSIVDVK